jgi:hypothetical protein
MRRCVGFALSLVLCNIVAGSAAFCASDDADGNPKPSAEASPAPAAPEKASESRIAIGIGVKVSTLGIGGEAAVPVGHRSNVRVGFNLFNYSRSFNKDGVTYNGTLNLRSAQATYDFFLVGPFHLSPGVLLYNGNQLTANASVPGGKTFTLNNVNYLSDAADPVNGTGKLSVSKAAPMVLIGLGNLVPRSHHFSTTFEVGAAYQGPPRIALNLTGSVCDTTGTFCRSISADPTVQSNIVAEQSKLDKKASPFRFYPVISFGIGYKF